MTDKQKLAISEKVREQLEKENAKLREENAKLLEFVSDESHEEFRVIKERYRKATKTLEESARIYRNAAKKTDKINNRYEKIMKRFIEKQSLYID